MCSPCIIKLALVSANYNDKLMHAGALRGSCVGERFWNHLLSKRKSVWDTRCESVQKKTHTGAGQVRGKKDVAAKTARWPWKHLQVFVHKNTLSSLTPKFVSEPHAPMITTNTRKISMHSGGLFNYAKNVKFALFIDQWFERKDRFPVSRQSAYVQKSTCQIGTTKAK